MDKFIVVRRYEQSRTKAGAVRVPGAQFIRLKELCGQTGMSGMALIGEMIDFCAERLEVVTERVAENDA